MFFKNAGSAFSVQEKKSKALFKRETGLSTSKLVKFVIPVTFLPVAVKNILFLGFHANMYVFYFLLGFWMLLRPYDTISFIMFYTGSTASLPSYTFQAMQVPKQSSSCGLAWRFSSTLQSPANILSKLHCVTKPFDLRISYLISLQDRHQKLAKMWCPKNFVGHYIPEMG